MIGPNETLSRWVGKEVEIHYGAEAVSFGTLLAVDMIGIRVQFSLEQVYFPWSGVTSLVLQEGH
jgi:hypothetical protein